MADSSVVRCLEGDVHIKGFKIAYIIWFPIYDQNYLLDNTSDFNPISVSSKFDTMLCAHGWLDNANSFSLLAPKIVEKYHMRVIAFDWPGHGKSSHSSIGYYSIYDYAIVFIRLLEAFKLNKFHFMGHSLGASIVPHIIAILPKDKWTIRSLICIEQFGALSPDSRLDRLNIDSILLNEDKKFTPKLYNSIDELVESRMYVTAKKYPGKQYITPNGAKIILERSIKQLNVIDSKTREKQVKYYLRHDPILNDGATGTLSNAWVLNVSNLFNLLSNIKCPVLGIFGDHGWPKLDFAINVLQPKMNNFKIARVQGSHHVHIDDPDVVFNSIVPFLDDVLKIQNNNDQQENDNNTIKSKL